MGAKQSKRSVDISGKEAESAGEVAAAGAGGEGRVEQLGDADALKPQLINGDAHIKEQTEKDIDGSTPENEKDATTEKESKEDENDKDKESAPVTNGDSELKENGETAPTPEDGKKPKKEKVKKKWSLRSISFSRKDKPKQEKKQKEDEPKSNGDPEKVPEETAETAPESSNDASPEPKTPEVEEGKTPETPVTEPLTNGSSTPESPKTAMPIVEEPKPAAEESIPAVEEVKTVAPAIECPAAPIPEPEQLPVNGLTLEDKVELPEVVNKIEEIADVKTDEPIVVTTETIAPPDVPVIKEVCVDQMPLIESTPPPLPANPPPSSVASFAATTMAPELTDASLANTAETALSTQLPILDTKNDLVADVHPESYLKSTSLENTTTEVTSLTKQLPAEVVSVEPIPDVIKPVSEEVIEAVVPEDKMDCSNEVFKTPTNITSVEESMKPQLDEYIVQSQLKEVEQTSEVIDTAIVGKETLRDDVKLDTVLNEVTGLKIQNTVTVTDDIEEIQSNIEIVTNTTEEIKESIEQIANVDGETKRNIEIVSDTAEGPRNIFENVIDTAEELKDLPLPPTTSENNTLESPSNDTSDAVDDLPPPPPLDNDDLSTQDDIIENNLSQDIPKVEANLPADGECKMETQVDGDGDGDILQENLKNKSKDALLNVNDTAECNGNIDDNDLVNTDLTEPAPALADEINANAQPEVEQTTAEEDTPDTQDLVPISDKMADLIPDIPVVPELKTETESSIEVSAAQ